MSSPSPVLNLLLVTASFPCTAPSSRLILAFPKLWVICVLYQTYISFVRGLYFSFILILSVADVAKGSPLLPACFFPFYFHRMYVYVRGIWLGYRRDVRLISYQRDLGVGMFPGVRRNRVFVGHSHKLHAFFVPYPIKRI